MTTNDKGKRKKDLADHQETSAPARQDAEAGPAPKLKRKEYERHMRLLHGELVALQEWVKASGAKIGIVFEGRDTAGKGGTIKEFPDRAGRARGCSGSRPCLLPPRARNRRCTSSDTFPTSQPPERS